jgi:hypothetical protein
MKKVRFEENEIVIIDTELGVIDILKNTPENLEIANSFINKENMRKSRTRKDSWFANALKNVKE